MFEGPLRPQQASQQDTPLFAAAPTSLQRGRLRRLASGILYFCGLSSVGVCEGSPVGCVTSCGAGETQEIISSWGLELSSPDAVRGVVRAQSLAYRDGGANGHSPAQSLCVLWSSPHGFNSPKTLRSIGKFFFVYIFFIVDENFL